MPPPSVRTYLISAPAMNSKFTSASLKVIRAVSRSSKVSLSRAKVLASVRHSQSAKFLMALALKEFSQSTHLLLKRLNSSVREKFVARSFITSVIFVARLQRSANVVAQMILKLSTQLQKQLLLKRQVFKKQLLKTSLLKL